MGTHIDAAGNIISAYGAAADFAESRGYTPLDDQPTLEVIDPAELKGKLLDQALEEWGLPKGGSADEKRERLAEHMATVEDIDPDANPDDAEPVVTTVPGQDQ